jgi:Tol biopolymer transport system component
VSINRSITGDSPAFSRDGTRLAYVTRGFGRTNPEIWILDLGSGELRSLVSGENPAWSPDGQMIAFDALSKAWVIKLDGSDRKSVAAGLRPSWSPDGGRIVFIREYRTEAGRAETGIFVSDVDGAHEHQLTKGHLDHQAAWSPDGKKIAFRRDHDIYVMDASGSHLTRLASGEDLCG